MNLGSKIASSRLPLCPPDPHPTCQEKAGSLNYKHPLALVKPQKLNIHGASFATKILSFTTTETRRRKEVDISGLLGEWKRRTEVGLTARKKRRRETVV